MKEIAYRLTKSDIEKIVINKIKQQYPDFLEWDKFRKSYYDEITGDIVVILTGEDVD
jgi:hypothetical protein